MEGVPLASNPLVRKVFLVVVAVSVLGALLFLWQATFDDAPRQHRSAAPQEPVRSTTTAAPAAEPVLPVKNGIARAPDFEEETPRSFWIGRAVRAGTIWINCFMDGHAELPFGGYQQSGLGRELGRFSIDEFTELKTVQLHLGPRTGWWHRP